MSGESILLENLFYISDDKYYTSHRAVQFVRVDVFFQQALVRGRKFCHG